MLSFATISASDAPFGQYTAASVARALLLSARLIVIPTLQTDRGRLAGQPRPVPRSHLRRQAIGESFCLRTASNPPSLPHIAASACDLKIVTSGFADVQKVFAEFANA